ncbi:glycogen debranching N-terminal domain-containing protein [Streptomyces sp. NPDC057136]|uniref:glycogen debranching N-terminal domain-containing protein n=1 Tax=Streptomyces sp. NPDC057136 TaxID=3346029 RepID=UPI00363B5482
MASQTQRLSGAHGRRRQTTMALPVPPGDHKPRSPHPLPTAAVPRRRPPAPPSRPHSASARTRRLSVEISLAADLVELGAIAMGTPGSGRVASVYDPGLRWTAADGLGCTVAAEPPPQDAVASAGLLRWDVVLAPGASYGIELSIRVERRGRTPGQPANRLSADARVEADDARVETACADGAR